MEKIVCEFLDLLKIPVSKNYVEKLIRGHPDFPSLLSISDIFQRLGINHRVTRIEKEQLHELPFPYLIPLDKGRGDIIIIKDGNSLKQYKDHLAQWSGAVVLTETTTATTDKENNDLYAKESKVNRYTVTILLALAGLLLLSLANSFSWTSTSLVVLSLFGVTVGYLLFAKELGISYAVVDAFCNTGKDTNCDRILKSEVTLLGVNFSDAVFTYFLFQVSILGFVALLSELVQPILFIIATVGLLTLPVVIFSIYYQYVVAKTWCRLCLIVNAILVAQAGIFSYAVYVGTVTRSGITPLMVMILALVALVMFSGVLVVKASVERYEKLNQQGGVGNRVKHTASVFNSFLTKQKKIDTQPFETEMVMGNPDAPIKVMMISNLYCNPCKLKHEIAAQLATMYPDKVNVTLRFVKSGKEVGSVGHLLGYWHQFIHGKEDESQQTAELMHNWFTIWDLQKFVKKYPLKSEGVQTEKLEAQHYAWIDEVSITLTPTFFINGYELPKEYMVDDLLAMVPSLADIIDKATKSEMTLQHI